MSEQFIFMIFTLPLNTEKDLLIIFMFDNQNIKLLDIYTNEKYMQLQFLAENIKGDFIKTITA